MRRMLRTALGAALAVTLAVDGVEAADPPAAPGSTAYPSGQELPGSGTGPSGPGMPGGIGMPGPGPGRLGPDGSPMAGPGGPGLPGDGGSGALDNLGGGAGDGVAGLGGAAGAGAAPPGMIGDFEPISKAMPVHSAATRFPVVPPPLPPPGIRGNNPGIVNGNGTTSILFKMTGLKISDNQSPRPQDRVFYSFNYFDNLNASVDRRNLSPIQNLQVYHQLFGLEKTIFDGRASIGFRVPLNTITLKSAADVPGLGGTSTAPGDLSIFLKYAVYDDERGNLISLGLQVTAPTGPGAFGGSKYYSYFRDTQIQPFIGYIFARDRFYVQGFSAIDVPTQSRDVTLLFTDVSVGYYVYRAAEPDRFLTAIVPTAEAHLTTPLNHRGFNSRDLASTPDVLNMTFGVNTEFRHRAVLTAAYVTPVTGPKPFNAELVLLLNIRFGASARSWLPGFPTQ